MVKITFFKRDGVYFGFRETGHAGFDDAGKDIVCAAISAMTMLVINAIEVSYASDVEYSIDEDTADIEVRAYGALPENSEDPAKQYAIAGIMQAYFLQLVDMIEDYDEYLDVTEVED
ncbi:MAG: ribosomal-processing cysteine protease Prp [Ruminococcaceae bacterium]|nr:ribosomal-processing cysteine protease Prp [Oscillospiraceae bacterium]